MENAQASAQAESSEVPSSNDSLESQEGQAPSEESLAVEQALAAKNPTPAQKKFIKELKLKYNGKESTESLPFEIPDSDEARDYMTKHLQMAKMAQSKASDYSQLEKEVSTFIQQLRKNPAKALSDPSIGVDVKELARQVIEEEIENSKKSPEQLEKEKLERELKEMKEKYEKDREDMRSREFERLKEQHYVQYDTLMSNALSKSDLPKSPYVVKKMADYMLLGLENGYDVTPEEVLPLVREEILEDVKQMFQVMPDEVLESFIGKDTIGRLRKKAVAKAKQAPVTSSQIKDVGAIKETKKEPDKKVSYRDFFKF